MSAQHCAHTRDCGHGEAQPDESSALTQRMRAAGYDWQPDCEAWRRRIDYRTRTARKDHATGRIKAGMRYVEQTFRDVDGGTGAAVIWRMRFVVTP